MKRKSFLLISVIVILSLLMASCQSTPGAGGKTKIRVATEAAYPPFEVINEQTKQPEGFDIDLMNAIAEKANLEVEYQNTPFDAVLTGMATCQFDAAISAITITPKRAEEIGFSNPYINAGQITTVRLDETSITGPADLKGKTIGVQLNTTGNIEADNIEGATVKPYDTVDLAFLDLQNGQVDAVVADYPTTLNFINKSNGKIKTVGEVFTDESYGIAVCKTNTALLDKINKALAELQKEGFITKLEEKWLTE
jgi:polar amino acid transport system substrate-binding protein